MRIPLSTDRDLKARVVREPSATSPDTGCKQEKRCTVKIQSTKWKTGLRGLLLGATVVGVMPTAVGCLDRPVATSSPRTSNAVSQRVKQTSVDKIDLVFMIDSSSSMADKQNVLALAVPDLLKRLVTPTCFDADNVAQKPSDAAGKCPAGQVPEFNAIRDIHIAVLTSSLGGHGADYCGTVPTVADPNDHARPIARTESDAPIPTYQDKGFLAWEPGEDKATAPEQQLAALNTDFDALVRGANQTGCGFEASLESWYRFLIDPDPPETVALATDTNALKGAVATGTDAKLLQMRADFLRPDSLVAIVALSDENDCSIIDGTLPPDVCEAPTLGADGKPTGCPGGRSAWPANYARGNFQGYTEQNGVVTGLPFPANQLAGQQSSFKVGDSTFVCPDPAGQQLDQFCLAPGTEACKTSPDSPECKSCYLQNDADCNSTTKLTSAQDPTNLRCWNQKQRFGVDMLYPLQRYIDGLHERSVYDRDGFKVPNPLFDDLPYRAAAASGTPLTRPRAEPRESRLVFFAPIVGVPWQDIARHKGDGTDQDPLSLSEGYLPTYAADGIDAINWSLILGNPLGYLSDGETQVTRVDPKDPLMIESNVSDDPAHPRAGTTHPVTGEAIALDSWNSVNGHEWLPSGKTDLQYACIFDLPGPVDCTDTSNECKSTADNKNPLYENRDGKAKGDTSLGTYETKKQYRAKAYPGTRFLQVAKSFGTLQKGNAIVGSICASNLSNKEASDFGYRPAVTSIIESLKAQLSGQCLPRTLATTKGAAPCLIIDAQYPRLKDASGATIKNDPALVNACKDCNKHGHRPLDAVTASLLTGEVRDYECLCEVEQFRDADLTECQTNEKKQLPYLYSGTDKQDTDKGGWCYVDPSSSDMPDRDAAQQIVNDACTSSTQKRTLRFINAETQNTTLFITCLGAASGDTTIDDGTAGTSGAAGSN